MVDTNLQAPADGRAETVAVPGAQQRLWLADQLTQHRTGFLTRVFLRLHGPLDVAVLSRALTETVTRHEVLRTSLTVENGDIAGLLRPPSDFRLVVEPLAPADLDAAVLAETADPLDVANGLPLRARLMLLAPDDHALLVTVHHFSFDQESALILRRELSAFYEAFAADGAGAGVPTTPPLPVQFRDLAAAEEGRYDAGQLASLVEQRRAALCDRSPFELPPDRRRPKVRSGDGAVCHAFDLPPETVRRLTRLGREQTASLFMVLLGAAQVVFYRYTGRGDVTTGSSSSTRVTPESEVLIGPFLNMLVLPGDVSGNPQFVDLVGRVRDAALDAYEARLLPFDTLVAELGGPRDPARTPLFQILVDFTVPVAAPAMAGLRVEEIPGHNGGAKYDISVEFSLTNNKVSCDLEWDTALYETATITRLATHLRAVLVAVADDPSLRVDDVPMLSPQEILDLRELGTPEAVKVPERCLHEMFAEQASRTPDAVALQDGFDSLSYAELDRRTTAVARGLRALGVAPDVPVGVLLDRSSAMVIAVLGILKANGAYLPIAPETPLARVRQLLVAAAAPICVVPGHTDPTEIGVVAVRDTAADAGCQALDVHELIKLGAQSPAPPSESPTARPDQLCAIYFTSGSTGEPKGVACAHRGWVSQMGNMQARYRLAPGEAVLLKTPLSFDDVAREIFWPLMVGAQIIVLPPGLHRDPRAILAATIEHRVVWLQFVPGMLAPFLDEIGPEHSAGVGYLRHVVSDGDRLRPETVAAFCARLGALGCQLNNHWGTTEASIDSTHHLCGPADLTDDGEAAVALGRPMENNSVYVLDHALRPVPRGAVGELCIGGVGLARGYLGDPGGTARAFVPHPWRRGERLYRTRDVGRLSPDGSLQYRGRRDHQVKIRGVRIELGEVEAAVHAFPGVADAVVTVWEPIPGDCRLAAYVTIASGDEALADISASVRRRLRDFLADRLASAAMPSAIVLLPRLLRMPNGKVDRRSLPEPDPDALHEEPFAVPATDTERALAEIWAAVLGATRLGANDDFFAAGGHSLLVVRAVNRMREAFGADVPLRLIFEHSTVRRAASELEELIIAEIETMTEDEAAVLAVESLDA